MWRPKSWMMLAVCGVMAAGCSSQAPVALSEAAREETPYIPQSGSGNGFDAAALAGMSAVRLTPTLIDRVSFGPDMKVKAIKQAGPALSQAEQSLRKPFKYEFRVVSPRKEVPWRKGWVMLGRCWIWQIEAAVKQKNWPLAAQKTIVATRFGARLCGGDAEDASLGITIANDARALIAPQLSKMSQASLKALSAGLDQAMRDLPPADETIQHELQRGKMTIQEVIDAYEARKLDDLTKQYGRSVKDAISFLKEKVKGPAAREYFDGFVREAEMLSSEAIVDSKEPASPRANEDPFDPKNPRWKGIKRPWRGLMPHVLVGQKLFVQQRAEFLTRTRLMYLVSVIEFSIKVTGKAPKDLKKISQRNSIDPYSGNPFYYRAEAENYKLWSVGKDGVNNGGSSTHFHQSPDMTLEVD